MSTTHAFKQRVLTCIDRLGDRDTAANAATELNSIAASLSPQTPLLSPFLSCLLSVDSSHRPSVRSHSLLLLSSLSHRLHPLPLPKILSLSLLPRLRDSDSQIRSSCVSLSASLSPHTPFASLLTPLLAALLSDQDQSVQIGAALCLVSSIEASETVNCGDLRRVLPRVLKLVRAEGFRAKAAVMGMIGSFVAAAGGEVVDGPGLMGCVVDCAVEMMKCDDWAARKAAAEALEKVASAVARRELVAEVKTVCVSALESRRFDKVKIARESMNRALEAWKEVNAGSDDESPSKVTNYGKCSPPLPRDHRRFSFETPQSKKKLTKSRSSMSDCSTVTGSTYVSSETPLLKKKTLSKSRSSVSSFSDDSTVTVSKKSSSRIASDKKSSSRPVRKSDARRPSEWKVDIRVPLIEDSPPAMPVEGGFENRNSEVLDSGEYSFSVGSSTKRVFIKRMYEEQVHKSSTRRFGSRVVPIQDVYDSDVMDVDSGARVGASQDVDDSDVADADSGATEEADDNTADFEDLSRIRMQLIQIEKQQSNLMDLLQTFMGASKNGINSLETRVSGLEKALGGITHDLAVQNGRIPNESAGNSCCMIPGAEFLSPKFWRRNEGARFAASKPCFSGSMHSISHNNLNAGETEGISRPDLTRDSARNTEVYSSTRTMGKTLYEVSQRRACGGGSLDGTSPRTCNTRVVQRT